MSKQHNPTLPGRHNIPVAPLPHEPAIGDRATQGNGHVGVITRARYRLSNGDDKVDIKRDEGEWSWAHRICTHGLTWFLLPKESDNVSISHRTDLSFDKVLVAIRRGAKARRQGWNGLGQFVYYVKEGEYQPHFVIYTTQGILCIWVPSVSDILAYDWIIDTLSDED